MKNLVFLAAVALCTLQLKAQQFKPNATDTLKKHPFTPEFRLSNPAQSFNSKFSFDYDFGLTQPSPFSGFYSRMPVGCFKWGIRDACYTFGR